jgi:hypothetical protein
MTDKAQHFSLTNVEEISYSITALLSGLVQVYRLDLIFMLKLQVPVIKKNSLGPLIEHTMDACIGRRKFTAASPYMFK